MQGTWVHLYHSNKVLLDQLFFIIFFRTKWVFFLFLVDKLPLENLVDAIYLYENALGHFFLYKLIDGLTFYLKITRFASQVKKKNP